MLQGVSYFGRETDLQSKLNFVFAFKKCMSPPHFMQCIKENEKYIEVL